MCIITPKETMRRREKNASKILIIIILKNLKYFFYIFNYFSINSIKTIDRFLKFIYKKTIYFRKNKPLIDKLKKKEKKRMLLKLTFTF